MTFEEFSADRKTQFAVIRGLEIIGEAIRNISRHSARNTPKFRGAKSPGCVTGLSMITLG